jgi:hypothetical protein
MSLKNLTIERFKRLERVDFNLNGVNILIGGNNSWKNNFSWVFPRMRRSNMGRTPTAQSYFGRNCAGASVHRMRRISEVSGIARNSLGLIASGQIAVRPVIVERLIQAITTLD